MAATLNVQLGANPTGSGLVTGTAVTLTTANAVTAGGLIVLSAIEFGGAGTPTCTFSGGGLTWASAATGAKRGSAYGVRMGYAPAPAGLPQGTVLTATFSASATELYLAGASFLGVDAVLVGNNGIVGGGAATAWTTGAVTPTADALIVGQARIDSTAGSTPGGGFTEAPAPAGDWPNNNGGIGFTYVYALLGASGVSVNPTGTMASGLWEGVTVALQISAAGGAPAGPAPFVPHPMPIAA
jgi:hypothetical protein